MNDPYIEKALREFDEEDHSVGAAVVGTDGQWIKVNHYLCEMLGYHEEELLRTKFQDLTHPEDLASELPYLDRLRSGGIDHYQFQKRYWHQHGHIVWGVVDRSVVRDDKGEPRCFISRIQDITAKKLAESKSFPFGYPLWSLVNSWVGQIFRRR